MFFRGGGEFYREARNTAINELLIYCGAGVQSGGPQSSMEMKVSSVRSVAVHCGVHLNVAGSSGSVITVSIVTQLEGEKKK